MTFYNYKENIVTQNRRPLFIDGLNVVLSNDIYIKTIKKIKAIDFRSLTEITTGRNAFGIIGKPSFLEQVSVAEYNQDLSTLICKNGIKRYIDPDLVQKNREIFENYKVFISKSAGAPRSDKNIIGKAFVGGPLVACTDTYFPVGSFNDETQALNLKKYFHTKFLRYLVSFLKSSQNVTQIVYKFVPLQDFSSKSDINWTKSIGEIDQQLYAKYKLSNEEIEFIDKMIKPM